MNKLVCLVGCTCRHHYRRGNGWMPPELETKTKSNEKGSLAWRSCAANRARGEQAVRRRTNRFLIFHSCGFTDGKKREVSLTKSELTRFNGLIMILDVFSLRATFRFSGDVFHPLTRNPTVGSAFDHSFRWSAAHSRLNDLIRRLEWLDNYFRLRLCTNDNARWSNELMEMKNKQVACRWKKNFATNNTNTLNRFVTMQVCLYLTRLQF